MKEMPLVLSEIQALPELQPRKLDEGHVERLVGVLLDGGAIPGKLPRVYWDGETMMLADGFHRLKAYRQAGFDSMPCEVADGTFRDALLYSLTAANNDHGLSLTEEDRANRVRTLLADPEWSAWSDQLIAAQCGVSRSSVWRIRESMGEQQHPNTIPASLPPEQQDKWQKIAEKGHTPRITERQGKRVVVDAGERKLPSKVSKEPEQAESFSVPQGAHLSALQGNNKDRQGLEIPPHLVDVFGDPWLATLATDARALIAKLDEFAAHAQTMIRGKSEPYAAWLRAGSILTKLRLASEVMSAIPEMIEVAIPYQVCGACEGAGCDGCRKSGWVNQVTAKGEGDQ